MGLLDNFIGPSVRNIVHSIQEENGRLWYKIIGGNAQPKKLSDRQKFELVIHNYVSQYIFTLLAELFSMGEYRLTNTRTGEVIESHPILDQLKKPNPMQTGSQFMYDYYLFRKIYGTANVFSDSKVPGSNNPMYILKNHLIDWPEFFKDKHNKLFITPNEVDQLSDQVLRYENGSQKYKIKYSQIFQFHDISNNITSWWQGPSRIDSIVDIITNSEKLIKSMGVNFDFAGKFLVSSNEEIENLNTMPMDQREKDSIRKINYSKESIFPVMIPPNIERFVNDSAMLGAIVDAFKEMAFLIGKSLNVPSDVIEMLGKSTYENQEQARAQIVDYTIRPDSVDWCNGHMDYFGMRDLDLNLELVYDHLPFMGVLEANKVENQKTKSEVLLNLIKAGVLPEEASILLGYNFTQFREPYLPSNNEQDDEEDDDN